MQEIKVIYGNILVIAFLTMSLFLLGLNNINKVLVYVLILSIGIIFFFLFLKIKKTDPLLIVELNTNQKKNIKRILMYLKLGIRLFFYSFFVVTIFFFWFGNWGNIWLEKSVQFFSKRFSNNFLFNIAAFLVPFVYWISIESIYRNAFSYLYKKYKLNEINDDSIS